MPYSKVTLSGASDKARTKSLLIGINRLIDNLPAQNFHIVDSTVADQGVDTIGSIKNLVDSIGTSEKATIYCIHNGLGNTTTYTLTTSETITSNITLIIEPGAIIDGAGTLTINGPFEHGLSQCFGSSIAVVFGRGAVKEIYPQWFGAKADWDGSTGTDDVTAINATITCANAGGGGLVKIIGRMKHGTPIVLKGSVDLEGIGRARVRTWGADYPMGSELYNSGTGVAITVSDTEGYGNKITNLCIKGNASSGHGITITANIYHGLIENCLIHTHGGSGIHSASNSVWDIRKNEFVANNIGIYWLSVGGGNWTGNYFVNQVSYGVHLGGGVLNFSGNIFDGNVGIELYITNCSGMTIHGNYFEYADNVTAIYADGFVRGLSIMGNYMATNAGTSTTYGVQLVPTTPQDGNGIVVQGNNFHGVGYGVKVIVPAGSELSNCILGPNRFAAIGAFGVENRYDINAYSRIRNLVIYDDGASQWKASSVYDLTDYCINDSGKVYDCITAGTSAVAGGPTGTGADITDGTVHWAYSAAYQAGLESYNNWKQIGLRKIKSFTTGSNLDYVVERAAGQTLADDGEQDTEMEEQGFFFFSASDSEYAIGYVLADGTVTLLHNSGNVGTTEDNDTTWNIFRDATTTTIHVQNKRGASANYIFYGLNAFY